MSEKIYQQLPRECRTCGERFVAHKESERFCSKECYERDYFCFPPRDAIEDRAWKNLPPDYRTRINGERWALRAGDNGTELCPLSAFPLDELRRLARLP